MDHGSTRPTDAPATGDHDPGQFAVDALHRCADACRRCADACLDERPVEAMVACIRTDLDCADLCTVTAQLVARSRAATPTVLAALLDACVLACRTCAAECERHDHDHCRRCAETCRACELACVQLQASIRSLPADD